MLENSVWKRYHEDKTINETLFPLLNFEEGYISNDETVLYNIVKRLLTKKELRAFIMLEAGINEDEIMKELSFDTKEDFEKNKKKAYGKIRGNKMAQELKNTHVSVRKEVEE